MLCEINQVEAYADGMVQTANNPYSKNNLIGLIKETFSEFQNRNNKTTNKWSKYL